MPVGATCDMTLSWQWGLSELRGTLGAELTMSVLLVTGIGVFVAGLVAVAFGVPVKEFSFGNTLILAGAVVACTGLIMISLSLVIRELRVIARQLGPMAGSRGNRDFSLPAAPVPDLGKEAVGSRLALPQADQSTAPGSPIDPPNTPSFASPPPWQAEMPSRDRTIARTDTAPVPPEPSSPVAPPQKARRNLLFSSSRKERERATARSSEPTEGGISAAVSSPSAPNTEISPPPSFDDAWPQSERSRAESRRTPLADPSADAHPPGADQGSAIFGSRAQNSPDVTVLKSGVVDGMAYSLYSDGSIEAQMPEGMMRFASIDQLRAHLEQRP